MVVVTFIAKEFSVTQWTDGGRSGELAMCQGLFGFDELSTVLAPTGGAPFTHAAMILEILVIVTLIAFVAEVGFAKKCTVGIASVVMFTLFNETNDFIRRGGSGINDHMRWIDGHDLDLVPWQGGLKLLEFRNTARAFGDSSESVKFLDQSLLDGTTLFEIVIMRISCIPVDICQCLHRDDGPSTTQIIFILDGDA